MKPKIVKKDGFNIVGMKYFGNNANDEIKDMWGDFVKRMPEIKNVDEKAGCCSYGYCATTDATAREFEYVAALPVKSTDEVPEGMVVKEIPAKEYAVFTYSGGLEKGELLQFYNDIYQKWLPQSGYQMDGFFNFEYYDKKFNPENPSSPDSEFYIYVPVKK